MSGEAIEAHIQLIEPINIQVRLSSDVLAVEDKIVSDAVRFIRNHANEDRAIGIRPGQYREQHKHEKHPM